MCGIVGYISFSGKPIDSVTFEQMTDCLGHRGPDDRGVNFFPGAPFVALGNRRLAILDLSRAGHQPMSNTDKTIWIVYNGEIYNFYEIRNELEKRGYTFKSNSDTEVLLHAYEEWDTDSLQKFNGMFAFGIWDTRKQRFWAARDRIGIKPFYYAVVGDGLIFASEIKAILRNSIIQSEPDLISLQNPTRFQISPFTGFRNIYKLPPGHMLTLKKDELKIAPYWHIVPVEEIEDEDEALTVLDALINDAVSLQMISDVPVGIFLSGGLDSSLITVLMSKKSAYPLSTFTIKFSDDDQRFEQMPWDSQYARMVSRLLNTNHYEFEIHPDIVDLLPKMVYHMDEPLADPAAINTYIISKAARDKGIVVLLNGMGGDEIFGGYRKYLACLLADYYQESIPPFIRRGIEKVSSDILLATSRRAFRRIRWGKRFLSFASKPSFERYLTSDLSLNNQEFKQLFHTNLAYEETYLYQTHKKLFDGNEGSYLTKMCLADTAIFLPEHNLTYLDKACMSSGVEGRPPLTDHRIVEFMFRVAPHLRIRRLTQKYLLKKLAERYLPLEIVYRPKAPFGAPLRSWIRRDLSEMVDDYLSPTYLKRRGIFNPKHVSEVIRQDREGKADYSLLIWQLLTTELWFRTFFDKKT